MPHSTQHHLRLATATDAPPVPPWPHPPFEIPTDILSAWRAAGQRSLPEYEAWQARIAALAPEKRREFDRLREGRLPDG